MVEKKLGYNIRLKTEKVNVDVKNEYLEMAKRADDAGLYYLAFPEFFGRFDRNRIHVVPYMAAVAARTEHVKLGTDVLQIPLLHPKHIADIGASLDIISEGRFILGAGVGMTVPAEFENFGIPMKERGRRTDEALDIIKKLWTEPAIYDYRGKFFTLRNVCSPPCIQKPHPPIWIGGMTDPSLRRTARYGNEWAAGMSWSVDTGIGGIPEDKWNVMERLEKLKQYCKESGRELVFGREAKGPKEVGYNQRMNININPDREKALEEARHFWTDVRKGRTQGGGSIEMKLRYAAVGNAEEVIEKLEEAYNTGAYLVTLYPLSTDSKSQWERIEKEVLPSL
ncbi:MAG: LLM class flavin-dependent oxidoreductase [Candidatus Hadarchaeaceae archaeon]|nr:LLM class flavin-dependent oxidoreductase [Hadesarchaea archaeon]MDH5685357.1 LLM class flavin-dependent oxidoreductase [Hadesarchaea archaeon]